MYLSAIFKRLYNLNVGSVWDLILAPEMIRIAFFCKRNIAEES